MIAGNTKAIMATTSSVSAHIRSGKLRGLAISVPKRIAALPDLPTFIEAGLPEYEGGNWIGFAVPAGTPKAVVEKLHKEIAAIQDMPEVQKQFANRGAEIEKMGPDRIARLLSRRKSTSGAASSKRPTSRRSETGMTRRSFLALAGGAAALPFAARAQQAMPVIGFLHTASAAPFSRYVTAFRQGFGEAGFVEGQNVAVEYRWAEGRFDRLPELATDLVRRRVSVLATPGGTAGAMAAKAATSTIPIVFGIPDDPVKFGLVASLARPGGNATGINFFTAELVAKRLGLLRELLPHAVRVAVLVNPGDTTNAATTIKEAEAAARGIGIQIKVVNAGTADEIDSVFATLERGRPDALFIAPGAFFNTRRVQLATLAARHGIPAAYAVRDYPEAGGLMSYGTSIGDMFRQVGVYTGRVLKGEKPADLPVLQPTKFEFVINLRTAKALGIEISPSLLARADEVIE